MSGATAIWWVRRDLRIADNRALSAALEGGRRVVPTFVLDDRLLEGPRSSPRRIGFLHGGLAALDASLRERGSRLVVRRGRPTEALARLFRETGAAEVVAEVDYTPFARRRDAAVEAALPVRWVDGLTVHPPEAVVRPSGSPYKVFGAFRRRWLDLAPPEPGDLSEPPDSLPAPPRLDSVALAAPPTRNGAPHNDAPALPGYPSPFPPGEAEALRRLAAFSADGIHAYRESRDLLDPVGTAMLSPYLRLGMVSATRAVVTAREAIARAADEGARTSAAAWLDELVWREFYIGVLAHHPHTRRAAFRSELRAIPWQGGGEALRAWKAGRTGYPVVDAAMRQLRAEGWIPNRARMIAASFLCKDLHVDWRRGERWFMRQLIDGDPAANGGGWQWVAGVGTDAAPYFRVFNPVLQGRRFDPEGTYVRRWVPQLRKVPEALIHEPWRMSAAEQGAAACRIGADYPAPIVEHAAARERALEMYRSAAARP